MESITFWFMLLFIAVGLLIVGLSAPLVRGQVKPNRLYGFRTPKTLSSERIWYTANAYAGKMSVRAGLLFIATAVVLYFVFRTNFVAYNAACAAVLLGMIFIHAVLVFRHLRSL